MTSAPTSSLAAPRWGALVAGWSIVFAAPHFYWAAGGRGGLGTQAGAADAALQQTWFAAYNVAAGCLGLVGALLALALSSSWGGLWMRRWLSRAAAAAAVVLLLRGLFGSTLLLVSLLQDAFDPQTPPMLLAIEPWFVLGGLVYGGMALTQRRAA